MIHAGGLQAIEGEMVVSHGGVDLRERDRRTGERLQALEEIAGDVLVSGEGLQMGEFGEQSGLRGVVEQGCAAVVAASLAIFAEGCEGPAQCAI